MTTETKVEAVAWAIVADGYMVDYSDTTKQRCENVAREYGEGANIAIEPLYPASAITALEGEVAYYKENFQSCMATLNAINNAIIEADEEGRGFVPVHQLQAALSPRSRHDQYRGAGLGDEDRRGRASALSERLNCIRVGWR